MRTTIDVPDEILAELKRRAASSNRTLRSVMEEVLRQALAPGRPRPRPSPTRLTTFGSGGLQPGVDLDDSAALLDVMG